MRKLSIHPLAEIIPPRRSGDSQRLKEEIELHGARDPVWIHEGRILHGYDIYQACTESGVKPRILKYNGDDPEDFLLQVALGQRHFSPSQRAMIAAKQANTKWGGSRIKAQRAYCFSSKHVQILLLPRDGIQPTSSKPLKITV